MVESLERTLVEPDMFRLGDGQETVTSIENFLRQIRQEQQRIDPFIPYVLDALPDIFTAARQLPEVLSGPKITFRESPLCITFSFYLRGYYPELGKKHQLGYSGVETVVCYSILPLNLTRGAVSKTVWD